MSLLGRSPGDNQGAGRDTTIVSDCLGLCTLLFRKHVQMTNRSRSSALHVFSNSWLMLPLAITTVVSIPFDTLTLSTA